MSKQQVAFIGLGVMGYPMAGHLAKAGYQTRVYNRTAAKAEQWCQEYEGSFALTPREDAVIAKHHRAQVIVVTHTHENEIRTLGSLSRGQPVTSAVLLAPLLGLGRGEAFNSRTVR